jgi:superfamily I DNA/RNA helicase
VSAQEILTLLTLLATPDDRVALRAWLAFGSTTERRQPYRRLLAAAREFDVDVAEVLRRLDAEEMQLPYTRDAVERWRELQVKLAEIERLRDDLPALVDHLLPEGGEEDLALLRQAAIAALEEPGDASTLANSIRYGVAQRETPLEAAEVRVMSMHASKGLTADLVVLAGLVEGLLPRINPRRFTRRTGGATTGAAATVLRRRDSHDEGARILKLLSAGSGHRPPAPGGAGSTGLRRRAHIRQLIPGRTRPWASRRRAR